MKHMVIKGFFGAVILYLTELQHEFGTILWVVLAMAAIDLLLNVGKEGKQLEKLGSAFVAIGAPSVISNNINGHAFTHTVLAMVALAYVVILYPQVVAFISNLKQPQAIKQTELEYITELKNQVQELAARVEEQNGKVPAGIVQAQTQDIQQ